MITRLALFEGAVKPGMTETFREQVRTRLVPLWTAFDGAAVVRVAFGESRDDGAPEFPLILAIDYPDEAALACALACDARARSRAVTAEIVAACFDGRIHHHVMLAEDHAVA